MITKDDFILITGGSGFIGTNLIALFKEKGYHFANFDKTAPLQDYNRKYWYKGNIMDKKSLASAFEQYKPTVVIHLAARTDTLSNNLEDYVENTEGSKNVVNEILKHDYVNHALFASTQYVYKSKNIPFPLKDEDYMPHTVYGISKKLEEQYIRAAGLKCKWTIFRPCNVWGPWHMRYPNELWRLIAKGMYVQPGKKAVVRTYAYVGNLVRQLDAIMNAEDELVNKKTYYLGDMPCDSYIWLNALSMEITGKKIRRMPKFLFNIAAKTGDFLKFIGVNFPLYSLRYRNMVEDFYAPSNVTIRIFGCFCYDYEANVKETIDWLRNEGAQYFDFWKARKN